MDHSRCGTRARIHCHYSVDAKVLRRASFGIGLVEARTGSFGSRLSGTFAMASNTPWMRTLDHSLSALNSGSEQATISCRELGHNHNAALIDDIHRHSIPHSPESSFLLCFALASSLDIGLVEARSGSRLVEFFVMASSTAWMRTLDDFLSALNAGPEKTTISCRRELEHNRNAALIYDIHRHAIPHSPEP